MKLKEGIDYHIKAVGKGFELSSMSLAGYTAGVIDLTRRGYEINQGAITNIGMLLVAKTIPKKPKPQKNPAKKKVVKEKSTEKVVTPKE